MSPCKRFLGREPQSKNHDALLDIGETEHPPAPGVSRQHPTSLPLSPDAMCMEILALISALVFAHPV